MQAVSLAGALLLKESCEFMLSFPGACDKSDVLRLCILVSQQKILGLLLQLNYLFCIYDCFACMYLFAAYIYMLFTYVPKETRKRFWIPWH